MKNRAVLLNIENDRQIHKTADSEFLFEYQRAVLLALKETGTLDEMQYRYAESKLKDQLRISAKKKNLCDNKEDRREAP